MTNHLLFILTILLSLGGCSGYRFVDKRNPLSQYDIKTLTVPMFINRTIYPAVSGVFTKEVTSVLNQYPDLRVYAGENKSADAILVGVLSSPDHRSSAYKTTSTVYIAGDLEDSIGQRRPYYLPFTTQFKMTLRLLVIKNPSWEDKELLTAIATGDIKGAILAHPKVIIDQQFNLDGSYGRQVLANKDTDQGGVVNATKNEETQERSIKAMAESAGRQFSELVLNAF